MRSDPHPSSTAENSRFSMMAVTAIHQRLANAEARVGAMVEGRKSSTRGDKCRKQWQRDRGQEQAGSSQRERKRVRPSLTDTQAEGSIICEDKGRGRFYSEHIMKLLKHRKLQERPQVRTCMIRLERPCPISNILEMWDGSIYITLVSQYFE